LSGKKKRWGREWENPKLQSEPDLELRQVLVRHLLWSVSLFHLFRLVGEFHPQDVELFRLRREVEVLRPEREILKKAISIFSQVGR
jgi:predicted SprT family Zn-dependent metalloprotease